MMTEQAAELQKGENPAYSQMMVITYRGDPLVVLPCGRMHFLAPQLVRAYAEEYAFDFQELGWRFLWPLSPDETERLVMKSLERT